MKKILSFILTIAFSFALISTQTFDVSASTSEQEVTYEDVMYDALEAVKNNLDDYIEITCLNVTDKESINLPNYNPNYIVPTEQELSDEIYNDMMSDLNSEGNATFMTLRYDNYDYDQFFTVAESNFIDLSLKPKYNDYPPIIELSLDDPVEQLGVLLTSAGLSVAAIYVLTGSAGVLCATAPVAWCLPYSVPATIAALTAIVGVVLINWDIICSIFTEIIDLFIECLEALEEVIVEFFDWVYTQVTVSSIAATAVIGATTFEFTEVKTQDLVGTIAIAESARRKYDVFLMQYVTADSFQIAIGMPVTEDFCVQNNTHAMGFSSYTWYQNVARRLIVNAGSGYTTAAPELHLYNSLTGSGPEFGFKHFHNCDSFGFRLNDPILHRTHSFFGLLYYSPNSDGQGSVHPSNPLP